MFSLTSSFLFVVRRMTSARNVAVVLAAHGAPMVSIDISVAVPGKAPAAAAAAVTSSNPSSSSSAASSDSNVARVVAKNMLRIRDESALKTLERLRLLLGPPELLKTRAGKKSREELLAQCPAAELLDAEGKVMDNLDTVSNEIAWRTAKTIRLGGNTNVPLLVPIRYNLPTVTAVQPPNIVYAGVPCVCTSITTMFAGDQDLLFEWRIAPPDAPGAGRHGGGGGGTSAPAAATSPGTIPGLEDERQPPLSTESVLLPPVSALGRRLRFRVRINTPDSMWTEVESPPVLPTPRGFEPMPRWALVKPRTASTAAGEKNNQPLRVCSYNILHDGFATNKRSRAKLYPFAPVEVLDINYRRARIAQELIKYDADISALQECGRSVFDGYLEPILKSRGYVCKLRMKNNNSKEGVALLLRKERFVVERWVDMTLNLKELMRLIEVLKNNSSSSEYDKISAEQLQQVVSNAQFREAMEQVPSVALICVAFDKSTGRRLVIGNTHLYYHALGCHIRLVQTFLLAHRMETLAREFATVAAPSAAAAAAAAASSTASILVGNDDDDGDAVDAAPEGKSKATREAEAPAASAAAAAAAASTSSCPQIEQILLGDFNFSRTTGGYELVSRGAVDKEHRSWAKSERYFWNIDAIMAKKSAGAAAASATAGGGPGAGDAEGLSLLEETGEAADEDDAAGDDGADGAAASKGPVCAPSEIRIALDLKLPQQHGGFADVYAHEKSLTCTNYALWFKEIIDHIFISKGLKVVSVLPAPSQEELSQSIAIPSLVFPSDHIALLADLTVVDEGVSGEEQKKQE